MISCASVHAYVYRCAFAGAAGSVDAAGSGSGWGTRTAAGAVGGTGAGVGRNGGVAVVVGGSCPGRRKWGGVEVD